MKNKILWLIVFPLILFSSCAEETTGLIPAEPVSSSLYKKTVSPENIDNPYDSLGAVYYDLYDAYYSSGSVPSTVAVTVDSLTVFATANAVFMDLVGSSSYSFGMQTEVLDLLDCMPYCKDTIVASTFVSSKAKSVFGSFLSDYETACSVSSDYADVHAVIVDYEALVLVDTEFIVNDKRKFLIASSIARYTAYAKKKKPKKNTDPEWALLISNLTASLEGADSSDADAVFGALLMGIMENK